MDARESYIVRLSDVVLGDVTDNWELVKITQDKEGLSEDIQCVFQTGTQVAIYCSAAGIAPKGLPVA